MAYCVSCLTCRSRLSIADNLLSRLRRSKDERIIAQMAAPMLGCRYAGLFARSSPVISCPVNTLQEYCFEIGGFLGVSAKTKDASISKFTKDTSAG